MAPLQRSSPPICPIPLKTKGGKPFSALANVTDEASLQLAWKVSNKVSAYLEQGHRMENMTWRLWHLCDLLHDRESGSRFASATATTSRQTLDDDASDFATAAAERVFDALTTSLAARLESDRKRSIGQLRAPDFRWTNGNDTLCHRAVMRTKQRDERAKLSAKADPLVDSDAKAEATEGRLPEVKREVEIRSLQSRKKRNRVDLTDETMRVANGPMTRKRGHDQSQDELDRQPQSPGSCSSSSSSTSSSTASVHHLGSAVGTSQAAKETRRSHLTRASTSNSSSSDHSSATGNGRTPMSGVQQRRQTTTSPPVCWRLTQQRDHRRDSKQDEKLAQKQTGAETSPAKPKQVRSTWTLQEIEDAERELTEQGVELSGPLLAMLADLKAGDLTKVKADDVDEDEDEEANEAAGGQSQPVSPRTNAVAPAMSGDVPILQTPKPPVRSHSSQGDLAGTKAKSEVKTEAPATSASLEGGFKEEDAKRSRPQCVNCGATSTPLWRRDANFDLQCNACGLYEKLHKAPRPKALKQRRGERKAASARAHATAEAAEGGGSNKTSNGSLSPQSGSSGRGGDEWIGIHAGATCANCGTSTTPLWRKDRESRIICNACGLYYKLHNAHRPVTMRMDAIKRRSRYDDRRRFGSNAPHGSIDGSQYGKDDQPANSHGNSGNNGNEAMTPLSAHSAMMMSADDQSAATSAAMMLLQQQQPMHHSHPGGLPGTPTSAARPFGQQAHMHVHHPNPLAATMQQQSAHLAMQNVNHHGHHHNHGSVDAAMAGSATGVDGIHIPSTLWEQQVCPVGAWGENCCQNLPQPSIDIQAALLAAGSSTTPADQAAVSAAMDALLHHNDWIAELNGGAGPSAAPPPTSSGEHIGSPHGGLHSHAPTRAADEMAAERPTTAMQGSHAGFHHPFDPTAVMASMNSSSVYHSAVGPSLPLKRRKLASVSRRTEDVAYPHTSHGTPVNSPNSALAHMGGGSASVGNVSVGGASNANTPVASEWWSFTNSSPGM